MAWSQCGPGTGLLLLSLHASCACQGVWLVMRHQLIVQVSSKELHRLAQGPERVIRGRNQSWLSNCRSYLLHQDYTKERGERCPAVSLSKLVRGELWISEHWAPEAQVCPSLDTGLPVFWCLSGAHVSSVVRPEQLGNKGFEPSTPPVP